MEFLQQSEIIDFLNNFYNNITTLRIHGDLTNLRTLETPIHHDYIWNQMLSFDDNKIKMTRKPGKEQKENLVGCTGKGNR